MREDERELMEEIRQLKQHYEQQLKVMIDNFNEQKRKYDKEYMEYSKELGRLREENLNLKSIHIVLTKQNEDLKKELFKDELLNSLKTEYEERIETIKNELQAYKSSVQKFQHIFNEIKARILCENEDELCYDLMNILEEK